MIKPVGNKILVKPNEVSNTTKTGIVMVNNDSDTIEAEVIAIGKGVDNCEVFVGDTVVISSSVGTKISHHDQEYLVIKQDNILIVL